jgi:protein O-GlcNAc transferase
MIEDILAQGQAAHRTGKLADAESSYRRVLAARPDHTEAMYALGVLMAQSRRVSESMDLLKRASCLAPEDTRIARNLALVLQAAGRPKEAEAEFVRLCEMEPGVADHRFGLALLYSAQGRQPDAIEQFRKGLALAPDNADAWCNLGLACRAAGENQQALEAFGRAVSVSPAMVKAHGNRGALLMALGRWEEAVQTWDRLLGLEPGIADVHADKGVALAQLGRIEEAADCFRRAEELDGGNALHPYNLARALQDLGCLPEAAEAYDRATARDPEYVSAYLNMGVVLRRMGNVDLALEKYARAIELQPDNGAAHLNRGKLLMQDGRFDEALEGYRRVLELHPDDADALSETVNLRRMLCDWDGLAEQEDRCRAMIGDGIQGIDPLVFMSLAQNADEQMHCGRLWGEMLVADRAHAIRGVQPAARPVTAAGERIRLGYISPDFRNHPVAQMMAGVFEGLDRSRFETFAYSIGPDDGSDLRRRLCGAFDHFADLWEIPSGEVVRRIAEDGIDVLVDLGGYTKHSRPEVLACRAAPIQVNHFGFSAGMGVEWMDYILADGTIIPPDDVKFYREKVICLPNSFMPVGDLPVPGAENGGRSDHGLPEVGTVYCAFNNPFKLNPAIFDVWMDILRRVPDSVLWLREDNEQSCVNLRREAEARGVAGDRLVFAPRMPYVEHLARHRLADLFLDCLPYNAHTTAVDALWMGVPVLTVAGGTFAGRVAASLLTSLGLPELIAPDLKGYAGMAVRLASDPTALAALKAKVEASRATSALFDTARFTRDLERAYEVMIERSRAGLPPEAFSV